MAIQHEPSDMVKALTTTERKTIETFYSAWKNKQPELLDEVCTPDWKDIPLGPGQADGPKGLKDIISGFSSAFPDVEIIIHEIYGTYERAGVRAEFVFTHNKELMGIPATGKKVALALHEFHHLKDGKLTHTWHLEDWFGLLMQSGVWSAKGLGQN
jgi:predicted ester cyclase